MAFHREPLSGGLVTNRDPALLDVGDLANMQNCTYRRNSQALFRSRGRALFGTVTATTANVDGIRDITFDNGIHYLIAMGVVGGNGRLRFAQVASASSFQDVGNISTAIAGVGTLEIVHYRNRFFAFVGASAASANEVSTNRVIYLSATAAAATPIGRNHGMLPVTAQQKVTTAAGVFSQTPTTGYYEYWVTELAQFTTDGSQLFIESTYAADPATVFVGTTATVPVITRPAFVNSNTSRWRIYRSPKKDAQTDKQFPTGFMIAELPSSIGTHSDTATVTSTAFKFPTSFNGVAPDTTTVYAGFTNAANLGADDAAVASAAVGATFSKASQGCYAFGHSGITGGIKGIEVELEGYVSAGTAPCSVAVSLGNRDTDGSFTGVRSPTISGGTIKVPVFAARSGLITSTSSGSPTVLTLGGSSDPWITNYGTTIRESDFNSSTVMAVIEVSKPSTTVSFDYIKIKVYYEASIDSVIQFPAVVYEFGDEVVQVGKNGKPPSASTGAVYQDQLVTDDVENPGVLRYSAPGDPEAFPVPYYLPFDTEQNDQIRVIKIVNNRLLVALDSSIWRVNYLPSERDASFDRGKALEPISRTFGCVNNQCACIFSVDGSKEAMAFVSDQGVHATDGYSFDTLTEHINWRNHIPVENMGGISAVTLGSGGTGYVLNEVLTVTGGNGKAKVKATGVSAGVITAYTIEPQQHGNNYVIADSVALTGGSGSGATLNITDVVQAYPIYLINNPEERCLELGYRNDKLSGTDTFFKLKLHYATEHLLEGQRLKVSGPTHMRNYDGSNYADLRSAWPVSRANGDTSVYLGYGGSVTAIGAGQVWIERDREIPAYDQAMSYTTRRMYLGGFGNEWRVNGLYGYMSHQKGNPVMSYTAKAVKTNSNAEIATQAPDHVVNGEVMHKVQLNQIGEGISFTMDVVADHNDMGEEFIMIEGEDFGEEDAGTQSGSRANTSGQTAPGGGPPI